MEDQEVSLTDQLGKIILNFGTLELCLCAFVTRLISDDTKIGAIVTSEMSFQNLIKAFDSLGRHLFKEHSYSVKFESHAKRLNIIEQERNMILHSAYTQPDENNEVFRLKVTAKQGKGLKTTNEKLNVQKIIDQSKEIGKMVGELDSFYKELYNGEKMKIA